MAGAGKSEWLRAARNSWPPTPVSSLKGTQSMTRFLVPAVAVGIVAGLALGADVKSGLEPGKSVPTFHPLMVTGSSAGEKQCPV